MNTETPAGPLRPVVERATANNPASRYGSVTEFLEALERTLGARQEHDAWESRETDCRTTPPTRMLSPSTTRADLIEMFEWATLLDESDEDDMKALTRVLPWCTPLRPSTVPLEPGPWRVPSPV